MPGSRSIQVGVRRFWERVTGGEGTTSPENRATNSVMAITFLVLFAFMMVSIVTRLYNVTTLIIVLIFLVSLLYYLSRVRKLHQLSIVLYAICSYLAFGFNYYFNSGINGPAILVGFVTYLLLIAITPRKFHLLWAILHVAIAVVLTGYEYYAPGFIAESYVDKKERFMDVLATYVICLAFVYLITSYLRNNYTKERRKAELRADKIEVQNRRISMQNKKLEALVQERDKLFSIISHDMRSPLGLIQGYLEMLTETSLGEEEVEIKRELLQVTKSTSDMLLNILNWSKSQIDGVAANFKPVMVNEVIEQTLIVQRSIAVKKNIDLSFAAEHKPVVFGDADMLQLIVRNLVNNALKFTAAGGAVSLRTWKDATSGFVAVKDNGVGMSGEKLNGLFNLGTAATYGTENEKGIGLGLQLCKEFVALQKGKIWVESNPGEGTEFFFSIPLAEH